MLDLPQPAASAAAAPGAAAAVCDPAHLRLKVRAGAGAGAAAGPILRDEGSLRAALTATRGAADAGDADAEPDERVLACAVLRAPESLTARDMVVRLRELRLPQAAGSSSSSRDGSAPAQRSSTVRPTAGAAAAASAAGGPSLAAGVDAVLPRQGTPEKDLAHALLVSVKLRGPLPVHSNSRPAVAASRTAPLLLPPQTHCAVSPADLALVHIARAPQFGPALTGATAAATLPNGHAIPVPPPPGASRASGRAAIAPLPQLAWTPLLLPPSADASPQPNPPSIADAPLSLKDGGALLWVVLPAGPGPNAAAGGAGGAVKASGAASKPWLQRSNGGVAGAVQSAGGEVDGVVVKQPRGGVTGGRGGGIVIL